MGSRGFNVQTYGYITANLLVLTQEKCQRNPALQKSHYLLKEPVAAAGGVPLSPRGPPGHDQALDHDERVHGNDAAGRSHERPDVGLLLKPAQITFDAATMDVSRVVSGGVGDSESEADDSEGAEIAGNIYRAKYSTIFIKTMGKRAAEFLQKSPA